MAHQQTVDVVVVGLGGAGIAAALTAHGAGAQVFVLEKTPPRYAGGNSRVSGQVWFNPNDVELAERHLQAMSWQYGVPDQVAAAWARETSRNTEWLRGLAEQTRGRVPRDVGDPYQGDGTDFRQISWGDTLRAQGVRNPAEDEYDEVVGHDCGSDYNVIGGSMGFSRLWLLLKTCLDDSGIEVRYETEVLRLVDEPGRGITGVVVHDAGGERVVGARGGVVLATGGFAANREMARNYLRLPNATPWGSPACTGDGIKMAQRVGADLAHPYNYMASPGIAMPPYRTGQDAMPRGARFINVGVDGRRFVDESVPNRHGKSIQRGVFDFHPGVPMWTVFDEDGRLAGPLVIPRQFFAVDWIRQVEGYEWILDNGAEIERGWITRADSIRELADKNYQSLHQLQSIDFVCMFVPIEGAFMAAISNDSELWGSSYERNVLLVSPSTLLFVVRTVAHLWRQERQKQNVQDIVNRGAELYDKLVGFVEDLKSVGDRLEQAKTSYGLALGKLSTGKGNVIRQAEMLKSLGVKPKKNLPTDLLDASAEDEPLLEEKADAVSTS